MGSHHPIRKTVASEPPPQIPDKLYFRIGDVARLCAVPTYVLRFWESEFPQLKPNKGGTGQRLYRHKDVEMALRIKSLLYEQGYTIAGARQVFKSEAARPEVAAETIQPEPSAPIPVATAAPVLTESIDLGEHIRERAQQQDLLRDLRSEMLSLLNLLGGPIASTSASPESPAKLMRPRLMLEPKPAARPDSRLRLERRAEKSEDQSPLFLFDLAERDIAERVSADLAVPAETAE
jgi:DNA-binding transcriptional MerR regulator